MVNDVVVHGILRLISAVFQGAFFSRPSTSSICVGDKQRPFSVADRPSRVRVISTAPVL